MTGFNGRDLASRVAGLLQGKFKGDLVAAAHALDADPAELRRIVEDQTQQPDLDVLAKLVEWFGVDVCWLMTGQYDWRAHMQLLEDSDEKVGSESRQLLLRLGERRQSELRNEIKRRLA